ncbi:Rad2 nuclease [Linnemannia exigua]|uniref:Rad2 nuclease n=1 Tax=Linnemannia exigua TaxID=604196 RepID=A0AAD4H6I4_9FUNG|nr:Rad2 nuclease [Linnemannia exigua]
MGIQGLLPLLKSIEKPVHLRDYAGKTLAVDGYVWLHKGAFSCAQELCLGQPTSKYISYFMRKIEMFKFFGVKPYVVFDGGYLPSKASTEQERLMQYFYLWKKNSRREDSKKQAMELHRAGKSKQAIDQFRKCVDVTPEMAFEVIQALKAAGVDFVVAPYEADAQLAYLEKHGLVDGIVTEDSDLLVFGCKKVIFKLDQFGAGTEILFEKITRVQEVSFQDWTLTEIRHMCILAGCDYLPSIPGMGLKTAQRLLRRYKTYDKVIRHVRMENTSMKIPSGYEMDFRQADLTFLYARVFDPVTKSMVHLNPIPDELKALMHTEEFHFLGPPLEPSVMRGIAEGRLNPIDKTPLSGPVSRRSNYNAKHSYAGKENRSASGSTLSAGKAINTYFQKTLGAPVTPTSTQTGTQKRELARIDNFATIKRRVLEPTPTPDSFANMSSIFPPTTQPYQHKSTPETGSQFRNVVVESRSRFFGHFDTIDTSEDGDILSTTTPTAQDTRSSALREDSGIGLDEAALLFSADLPKVQAPKNSYSVSTSPKRSQSSPIKASVAHITKVDVSIESQELEEVTIEYKRAEAKVIQSWREKFSNTPQPGRTPGMKRTFQNCGRIQLTAKAKPAATTTVLSKDQSSTQPTTTAIGESVAGTRTLETATSAADTRQEATLPASKPPIYPLDAGRRVPSATSFRKEAALTTTVRSTSSARRVSGSSPSSSSSTSSSSTSPSSSSPPSTTSTSQSTVYDEEGRQQEDADEVVRPKLCLDRFRFTASPSSSLSAPVRLHH